MSYELEEQYKVELSWSESGKRQDWEKAEDNSFFNLSSKPQTFNSNHIKQTLEFK
jgi:transposase